MDISGEGMVIEEVRERIGKQQALCQDRNFVYGRSKRLHMSLYSLEFLVIIRPALLFVKNVGRCRNSQDTVVRALRASDDKRTLCITALISFNWS